MLKKEMLPIVLSLIQLAERSRIKFIVAGVEVKGGITEWK